MSQDYLDWQGVNCLETSAVAREIIVTFDCKQDL